MRQPPPLQLAAAYSVCRGITRSNARNFYWAFLVLPSEKRDALAAVYAFMRHSDDIADDTTLPPQEKAARLEAWRAELHRVLDGGATDDPVLFALADAQRRFEIPIQRLDELITGTAMDVSGSVGAPPNQAVGAPPSSGAHVAPERAGNPAAGTTEPTVLYRNFDELRNYCYHVASVVGLVCIKIFGYRDPAAEPLAEKTGIAFQLTNIIRDVKEDALMGRIYIPADDLARFQRTAAELAPAAPGNGFDASRFRGVLELETFRARDHYQAAQKLLPLIDEDSRPALWVLVEIYRRLLEKIVARNYDVFTDRIRLSAREKGLLLLRGLWLRLTRWAITPAPRPS